MIEKGLTLHWKEEKIAKLKAILPSVHVPAAKRIIIDSSRENKEA